MAAGAEEAFDPKPQKGVTERGQLVDFDAIGEVKRN